MKRWQLLIPILALSTTGAFADEAEDEAEEEEAVERICVNRRSINSLTQLMINTFTLRPPVTNTISSRCRADASGCATHTVLL